MRYAMRWLTAAAVLGLAVGAAGRADAGVIYDNGAPDLGNYLGSGSFDLRQVAADSFRVSIASTLRDVHWWGNYGEGQSAADVDSFTIFVYNNAGGAPAVTPFYTAVVGNAVNRTATGTEVLGLPLHAYSADVTPLALAPGVTYWLSIVDQFPDRRPFPIWSWATSAQHGDAHYRFPPEPTWRGFDAELAFNLTGDQVAAVPEPSTLAPAAVAGRAGVPVAPASSPRRLSVPRPPKSTKAGSGRSRLG